MSDQKEYLVSQVCTVAKGIDVWNGKGYDRVHNIGSVAIIRRVFAVSPEEAVGKFLRETADVKLEPGAVRINPEVLELSHLKTIK